MSESDINFSELVDTAFNNSLDSIQTLTNATAAEGSNLGAILVVIILFVLLLIPLVFVIFLLRKLFNGA